MMVDVILECELEIQFRGWRSLLYMQQFVMTRMSMFCRIAVHPGSDCKISVAVEVRGHAQDAICDSFKTVYRRPPNHSVQLQPIRAICRQI